MGPAAPVHVRRGHPDRGHLFPALESAAGLAGIPSLPLPADPVDRGAHADLHLRDPQHGAGARTDRRLRRTQLASGLSLLLRLDWRQRHVGVQLHRSFPALRHGGHPQRPVQSGGLPDLRHDRLRPSAVLGPGVIDRHSQPDHAPEASPSEAAAQPADRLQGDLRDPVQPVLPGPVHLGHLRIGRRRSLRRPGLLFLHLLLGLQHPAVGPDHQRGLRLGHPRRGPGAHRQPDHRQEACRTTPAPWSSGSSSSRP